MVLAVAFCLAFVQIPMVAFADYVDNDIEVSPMSVTMYLCDGYEKTVTAKGSGTVPEGTVVEWSVEDETIATVEDGVFKPVALGETVAYAKYGNVVAELQVTVLRPEIVVNDLYQLVVGETATLYLEKSSDVCKTVFSSDNESVATVDENGRVTAVSAGVANITIQGCGAKPVETQIQVEEPGEAEIFVYTENFRVGIGQCLRFPHKVEPSVYQLSYASSDESIATVDEKGYITGITAGTVVITITAPGGVTKDVPVTITEGSAYTITIPDTNLTLNAGERHGVSYGIDTEDFDVRFTSSDESVVKVEDDNVLVAVAEGTAVVTASATGAEPVEIFVTVVNRKVSAPGISASYSAKGIKISWETVEDAKRYEVYRKTGSGTWKLVKTLGKSATGYTDKDITYKKTYSYRVKAIGEWDDMVVESAYSSTVKKTTSTIYAPTTVKAVRNGYKSVKITWSRVYPATGYEVYRATSKTGKYTRVAKISKNSTLSYINKELTTGKTYYYKVRAVYDTKKGNFSAVKSATPNLAAAKVKKSVTSTSSSIKISWEKVSYASGYYVYRKKADGNWKKVGTVNGNKTFSYKDNPSAGAYMYSVRAYRIVNGKNVLGVRSDSIYARTLKKPTVTVTAPENEFKNVVKWTKITGATGYQVYQRVEGGSWKRVKSTSASVRSYTASVPHGKVIDWKVRAIYQKEGFTAYGSYSKSAPCIVFYYPDFEADVLSKENSKARYIKISVKNNGSEPMVVYAAGAVVDYSNENYNREMVMVNGSTEKEIEKCTINPGKEKEITYKVIGDVTRFTEECFVGIYFVYDGIHYLGLISDAYGTYYDFYE